MCTVMLTLMKPKVKPRILALILGRNVAGPESPSSDPPPHTHTCRLVGGGGGFQPHHSARPCYGPVAPYTQRIKKIENPLQKNWLPRQQITRHKTSTLSLGRSKPRSYRYRHTFRNQPTKTQPIHFTERY